MTKMGAADMRRVSRRNVQNNSLTSAKLLRKLNIWKQTYSNELFYESEELYCRSKPCVVVAEHGFNNGEK